MSVMGTANTLDAICSVASNPKTRPASKTGSMAGTDSKSACTASPIGSPSNRHNNPSTASVATKAASSLAAATSASDTPASASVRYMPRSRSSAITYSVITHPTNAGAHPITKVMRNAGASPGSKRTPCTVMVRNTHPSAAEAATITSTVRLRTASIKSRRMSAAI